MATLCVFVCLSMLLRHKLENCPSHQAIWNEIQRKFFFTKDRSCESPIIPSGAHIGMKKIGRGLCTYVGLSNSKIFLAETNTAVLWCPLNTYSSIKNC